MSKQMGPLQISHLILDTCKQRMGAEVDGEGIDNLRRGIGISLSGVHTLLIATAETREAKTRAVGYAVDSIKRLIATLDADMEAAGLGRVKMSMDTTFPKPESIN